MRNTDRPFVPFFDRVAFRACLCLDEFDAPREPDIEPADLATTVGEVVADASQDGAGKG